MSIFDTLKEWIGGTAKITFSVMGEHVDIPRTLPKEQQMFIAQYSDIINTLYQKLEDARKKYGEITLFGKSEKEWPASKHERYNQIIVDAELAREHLLELELQLQAFANVRIPSAEIKGKTFFDTLRQRALDKNPENEYARVFVKKNVLVVNMVEQFLKQPAPRRFLPKIAK